MKIITCAGYLATGSSAVTDYLSEFKGCSSIGTYEVRFIHDPNGIRDLEYNLIENNNRHNTSHAIKNYMSYAKKLNGNFLRKGYKRYVGDKFEKYTKQYVEEITELTCECWWHYDRFQRGELFNDIDVLFSKIYRKIYKLPAPSILKYTHEKGYFTSISREKFIEVTKKYIENVIMAMAKNNSEYIMVDQLLPPTNIEQYLDYFDDIKVIVVDRDPRDLFLLEAARWRCGLMPYKDVEEFCKWFEIIRTNKSVENTDKILHVKFEDLIYNYETETAKISAFVGLPLERHVLPKTKLNPDVSIKNTNLIMQYPEFQKEIEVIERLLPHALYDFPK